MINRIEKRLAVHFYVLPALILLFSFCTTLAQGQTEVEDTIFQKKFKVPPYLIVTLPSTDCIMCRAGVAGLLEDLSKKSSLGKIFLASDDDYIINSFLQRKPKLSYEILSSKFLYDRYFNNTVATAYLIDSKNIIKKYNINTITEKQIDTICTVLYNKDITKSKKISKPIKISLPLNIRKVTNQDDGIIVFDEKKQLAFFQKYTDTTISYLKPTFDSALYTKCKDIIFSHCNLNLVPTKKALFILSRSALLPVLITDIEIDQNNSPTILFRINVVYTMSLNDSEINYGVRGYYFTASGISKDTNILNLTHYKYLNLIDTIKRNSYTYFPEPAFGFFIDSTYSYQIFICRPDTNDIGGNSGAVVRTPRYGKHIPEILFQFADLPRHTNDLAWTYYSDGTSYIANNYKKEITTYNPYNVISYSEFFQSLDTGLFVEEITTQSATMKAVVESKSQNGKLLISNTNGMIKKKQIIPDNIDRYYFARQKLLGFSLSKNKNYFYIRELY